MTKKKKVGSAGRFGPRYGKRLKNLISVVEKTQKKRHMCPKCKMKIQGNFVKEYWGEGTERARNLARYGYLKEGKLPFEEGVDAYVPYAGKLKDNIELTTSKIKATMCNCGALNIPELHKKARLALVSSISIREGGVHDVIFKETDMSNMPT